MTARESDSITNEGVTCSRNVQSTVVGQKGGVTDPEGRENVGRA